MDSQSHRTARLRAYTRRQPEPVIDFVKRLDDSTSSVWVALLLRIRWWCRSDGASLISSGPAVPRSPILPARAVMRERSRIFASCIGCNICMELARQRPGALHAESDDWRGVAGGLAPRAFAARGSDSAVLIVAAAGGPRVRLDVGGAAIRVARRS